MNNVLFNRPLFGGKSAGKVLVTSFLSLATVAGLNCKTDNAEPSRKGMSTDASALVVTATNDDPCRIVLKQQRFVDTSVSRETKTVVVTLLSDGSGVQELFDENSLMEKYRNFGTPTEYYLTEGLRKIVYNVNFFGADGVHDHVSENIFVHSSCTKTTDSLFSEDSSYVKDTRSMYISALKINPAANRLIVSTDDFIRCYNLLNGSYSDIRCRVPFELLWTGNSTFIYNQRLKSKTDTIARSIRYDITSKKSTVLWPDDTLPLKNASATRDGDCIFRYTSIDFDDTSGKLGDSLYFCDAGFKTVATAFVANDENVQYKISLSGTWIYYTEERAVRRVKVENVKGVSMSLDKLNGKAQVVFPFPVLSDGTDITAIAHGTITQLLPLQNGSK